MNERIETLAKAAGYDMINKAAMRALGFDVEKFAELIVAECGNWFNDRLVVNPDYGIEHRVERNRAVVGVMKEFNQHFGVEE